MQTDLVDTVAWETALLIGDAEITETLCVPKKSLDILDMVQPRGFDMQRAKILVLWAKSGLVVLAAYWMPPNRLRNSAASLGDANSPPASESTS